MFVEKVGRGSRVRVKICGITNEADARSAIELGADALGFNLFPGSKRYLDIRSSQDWMARLPREIPKVAVLVNPTAAEAMELVALPFIDALQLHGTEPPEFCRILAEHGIPFAKAVPVSDEDSLDDLPSFFTDTILLDSSSRHGFGGSGEPFSWALGRRFVESHLDLKVILAGGLTPENVNDAISQVGPFAVDVTTGVESSPGRKDPARLRAFFAAVGSG